MALPSLNLSWGRPKTTGVNWYLGLLGVQDRDPGSRRRRYNFFLSLQGLLLWLLALAVVAYFAGAAALWLWWDRKPYNYVTYTDLVLPTRWSEIQGKRGKGEIMAGLDDLKAAKWGEAAQKLRRGIYRYPKDTQGRIELARFYLAVNQRNAATKLLAEGLDYGYPGRTYIETVCRIAAESEDYDLWITTAEKMLELLPDIPANAVDRRWAFQQQIAGLMAADRGAEVVALTDKIGADTPTLREYRVLGLLRDEKAAEAVAYLEKWQQDQGVNAQTVRLLVRAYRETGRFDDMEKAITLLRSYSPSDSRPYVYGVVQRSLGGRQAEAEASLEDFFLRFGASEKDTIMLAAPLAEIGEWRFLQRLLEHAKQQGFKLSSLQSALLKALIKKGQWQEAARVLEVLRAATLKPEPAVEFAFDLAEATVKAATDPAEGAQVALLNLIRTRQYPFRLYQELIADMRLAGRIETARQLVTFGQGVYPNNANLRNWQKELDTELAAIEAAKPKIQLTTPSATVAAAQAEKAPPAPVRQELNQKTFDQELDELRNAQNHAGLIDKINSARASRPRWFAARDADLWVEQMNAAARIPDLATLRLAARQYLNGDRPRTVRVQKLADELQVGGYQDEAVFLLREVLLKIPNETATKQKLTDWGVALPAEAKPKPPRKNTQPEQPQTQPPPVAVPLPAEADEPPTPAAKP